MGGTNVVSPREDGAADQIAPCLKRKGTLVQREARKRPRLPGEQGLGAGFLGGGPKSGARVAWLGKEKAGCLTDPGLHTACFPAMLPPRGDVTALFLGPPGSGKSALIAALCDGGVELVEIPDGRPEPGVPSLRAAGPGLFLGELSCPPAAPGPWAAEANVLVLVLPGPEGDSEPLAPALGEAARAALARGTPLLAVLNLRPGDPQNEAQARNQTAALLRSAGLGAAPLFVLPADCGSSDGCEELERLRGALRSQAEALQR